MELPPSSDYTDMGRMSKSPGRNKPIHWLLLAGLVWILHLHPHPILLHTQAPTHTNSPLLFDTLPSTLITQWIKMKTQKWIVKKRRREGVVAEARKTKCVGLDQPGISSYVVPTHWLRRVPFPAPQSLPPHDWARTTQTLNDFMI